MLMKSESKIYVKLEAEAASDELEPISREFIRELETIPGVETIEPLKIPAPAGTKGEGIDWSTIGLILSSGAVSGFVGALSNWLTRDRRRSIEVTIDGNVLKMAGISQKEQQEVLAMFKARTRPPLVKGEHE